MRTEGFTGTSGWIGWIRSHPSGRDSINRIAVPLSDRDDNNGHTPFIGPIDQPTSSAA